MRRGFMTNIVRLGKRHIAMILDDHAIAAAMKIGARIVEAALVDILDWFAIVARRAGERGKVDDADNHLGPPEYGKDRITGALANGLRDVAHNGSISIS